MVGGLKSAEEIIISSILVQMSRWEIVKQAVETMRERGLTDFSKLYKTKDEELYQILKILIFTRRK